MYNQKKLQADIIVDLQYGDTGKGKITHYLCAERSYTHVIRYNGGANAGHTIFHNGKKFITHQVPAGIFFGIRSIIGPGCVVEPEGLLEEIKEFEAADIRVSGLLFVANNAHVVTAKHLTEDGGDKTIGTTRRGIGPAYRDKYARVGVRAETVKELQPYLIDMYKEFHSLEKKLTVLAEGAQGFGLDIDWGDYPYVTSSHCISAGALLNGFPPQAVREIWGVAKSYETYVGNKQFEPKDPIFEKIREVGQEYGATTGRPRQCNWMDIDLLEKAVRINGVTHVVFNKMDVLNQLGVWKIRLDNVTEKFNSKNKMKAFIKKRLSKLGIASKNIYFSESKEGI